MIKRSMVSGAAMAELVILAPLLLLVLLGAVEAGRAGNLALTVAGAARAGVAYGAQNHTTAADLTGNANGGHQRCEYHRR